MLLRACLFDIANNNVYDEPSAFKQSTKRVKQTIEETPNKSLQMDEKYFNETMYLKSLSLSAVYLTVGPLSHPK